MYPKELDLKSDRKRVQWAILLYLLIFIGTNLSVWVWFVLHRHGPHNFPLGQRVERFGDLLRFSSKFQYGKDPRMLDTEHLVGTLFPKNYPPFAIVIYLFLLQVCAPYALAVLVATVLLGVGVACVLLWRRVRRFASYRSYMGVAVFATGLFGWGTEQTIMRGNMEGVMWIAVCLGAALYVRRRYMGAAIAFGVACCLKPYPVLWLGLMARQRRYREVIAGLLAVGAVTLASLLMIDRNPLRAYRYISGKSSFFANYIGSFRPMEEMKGDHALLQTMKTIARVVRYHGFNFPAKEYGATQHDPLAWKLYHACLALTLILGLIVLCKVWNKPVLNQIFAVACVSTVFPLVAGDYTLTVLLVPMGFFLIFMLEDVAEGRTKMPLSKMLWFLLPCAWINATTPLWILHGVLECAAILVLLGASLSIPLPSTLFAETSGRAVVGTSGFLSTD